MIGQSTIPVMSSGSKNATPIDPAQRSLDIATGNAMATVRGDADYIAALVSLLDETAGSDLLLTKFTLPEPTLLGDLLKRLITSANAVLFNGKIHEPGEFDIIVSQWLVIRILARKLQLPTSEDDLMSAVDDKLEANLKATTNGDVMKALVLAWRAAYSLDANIRAAITRGVDATAHAEAQGGS